MLKGFNTARQIIDEALAGIRDFDRKREREAAMYFLRGYREWRIFNSKSIVEMWLPVTLVKTVNLPDEMLEFLSIGIPVNGEMFTFTLAQGIVSPLDDPMEELLEAESGEDESLLRSLQYGYGSNGINDEYYFRLDEDSRRIVLKKAAIDLYTQSDRTEVLLRYISTGVSDLDNTMVPGTAYNMLVAYIEWKLVASMPTVYDRGYRMDKKQEYLHEVEKFQMLDMPTIDELYDVIFETSAQTPRRL